MEKLRDSSVDECFRWYLERENRKHGTNEAIPRDGEELRRFFLDRHKGKWFGDSIALNEPRFSIVRLTPEEIECLVFLESCWTVREGLVVRGIANGRLLRNVEQRAFDTHYFEETEDPRRRILLKYQEADRHLLADLSGPERIVIRTLFASERANNPLGSYYLHDGNGRMLSYMYFRRANAEGSSVVPLSESVEAFLAEIP